MSSARRVRAAMETADLAVKVTAVRAATVTADHATTVTADHAHSATAATTITIENNRYPRHKKAPKRLLRGLLISIYFFLSAS